MIDVRKILVDVCGSKEVLNEGIDLIESGLLDSFAVIELFSKLEDEGVTIHITKIDREILRSVEAIENLVKDAISNGC